MIRAVLVEDEPKSLDILKSMLGEHCPSVSIIGTARSVEEGISVLQSTHPELVFLDVSLSPGTSFDILNAIGDISFQVIFTTAYKDYALEAIRHSALDYLMKPIDIDELITAVKKYENKFMLSSINKQIQTLLEKSRDQGSKGRIALPTFEGLTFVKTEEIVRCEASGSYTHFIMSSGEKIMVSRNIKEFEETLAANNFYRVHDSHIVNIAYIKKYVKGRGGYVVLNDNSTVEVSARRKSGFLDTFEYE